MIVDNIHFFKYNIPGRLMSEKRGNSANTNERTAENFFPYQDSEEIRYNSSEKIPIR